MRNYRNKSKLLSTALCAGIFSLGLVSTANATLESRLGGHAYYDMDLDITWAADYVNINSYGNWDSQMAWASGLTVDGIGGWRLPEIDEMKHLYNIEAISFSSPNPFSNIEPNFHWSSSEFDTADSVGFDFTDGTQTVNYKGVSMYAWAVHSGDVVLIPEPQTYTMLLAGLGLLGFIVRRKKENA